MNRAYTPAAKPACRCGKRTVYFRAYNGESLCQDCFTSSIIEKTKKTISKYEMLRYGDKIAVAISGGKDSASLLYALNEITKGHGTTLFAITVNEGISGYRDEAIRNAESLCDELKIPLLVESYEELFGFTLDKALAHRGEKTHTNSSACALCGPLRRRSIDKAANKVGANVVATGHNLDDVVQTFYINLHSGDIERIRWLGATSRSHFALRRIKPFMEIYEQELAFFAYLKGLPIQRESCPYMNEGIRTEIRENLNSLESNHPGIKYSTLKAILTIAANLELPEMKKSVRKCAVCGSVCSGEICSACSTASAVTQSISQM